MFLRKMLRYLLPGRVQIDAFDDFFDERARITPARSPIAGRPILDKLLVSWHAVEIRQPTQSEAAGPSKVASSPIGN